MEKCILTSQLIPMNLIDRPQEPDRLDIDEAYIEELAESIREIGLQNAISVVPCNGRFEIIYGDRRFLACKRLELKEIIATIQDVPSAQVSILRATENLQRENLTPIEEGLVYKRLHETQGLSWEQISKRTGKSAGVVKRRYDLLKMPQCLIDAVHKKQITYTVAEELVKLTSIDRVKYYLGYCVDHGATQEVVRAWVNEDRAAQRQAECGNDDGGWKSPIEQSRPVYVACDICESPQKIGEETVLRICHHCAGEIRRIVQNQ